jgi:hypothetical protein
MIFLQDSFALQENLPSLKFTLFYFFTGAAMTMSSFKKICFLTAFTALLHLQAQTYSPACLDDCQDQFWAEADYLYWQVQDAPKVIPLVIEQPTPDAPFEVVLGGKKLKNDWHSGAKFTLGYWVDSCQSLAAEVSYFFLGQETKRSSVYSDANGSPALRVPYFNVTTGLPDSAALATPGLYQGSAILKVSNRMQGVEVNLRSTALMDSFDVLAGFRYWNFDDRLSFLTNSPLVSPPSVYNNQDRFKTENNFYGGQIGVSLNQCLSAFLLNIQGKLALGAMCQKSTINGQFQTDEFTGSVQTFEGGYFALPTNIGTRKKTRFSVIPEVNLNLGYRTSGNLLIRVGYTFLYASNVLRASKQMSQNVNPTQSANIEFTPTPALVGEASPTGKLKSCGLWVQGVNVGIQLDF